MDGIQNLKVTLDNDKGVAIIAFDRLAKRNAFSQAMIGEMVTTLDHLDNLDSIRAVVITGGPEGPFCGKSRAMVWCTTEYQPLCVSYCEACHSRGALLFIPMGISPKPDCCHNLFTPYPQLTNMIIAGMDLNELVHISTSEAYKRAFLKDLTDAFARFTKPIIAAVVGFAVSLAVF